MLHGTERLDPRDVPTDFTENGNGGAGDGVSASLEEAWAQLDRWRSDLVQLGRIRLERARLAARDGAIGALLILGLLLTTSTALVAGTVLFVRGLANGLAAATGRGWLGDLAGGVVVLAAVALAGWWACNAIRRRALERVRRSLSVPESNASEEGRVRT